MNNRIVIIGVIVVVLILGALSYRFFANTPPTQTTLSPTITEQQNNLPTAAPTVQQALEQGGSSYLDPQGVFSFLYPNSYTQDLQNDGKMVRVYMRGATQKGQTEMYDGVIVLYEGINLKNVTLSEYIDAQLKNMTADGTMTITQPKKALTLNSYPGFTYSAQGLGEATHYLIQKDKNSPYAVEITTSVMDPEKVGYQEEVNAILAKTQILK